MSRLSLLFDIVDITKTLKRFRCGVKVLTNEYSIELHCGKQEQLPRISFQRFFDRQILRYQKDRLDTHLDSNFDIFLHSGDVANWTRT